MKRASLQALQAAHATLTYLAQASRRGIELNTRFVGRLRTAPQGVDQHTGAAKAYAYAAQLLAEHFPSVFAGATPREQDGACHTPAHPQPGAAVRLEVADNHFAELVFPSTETHELSAESIESLRQRGYVVALTAGEVQP